MTPNSTSEGINFENTEIAFAHKTKQELNKSRLLFSIMNKAWVVNLLSPIGLFAIEKNLPFAQYFVKKTIFDQFIGGTTLPEAQDSINMLGKQNVSTMLDYGVEGKEEEEDFERTKNENLNAIRFAAANQSVPVVTIKVTGLTTNDLVTNYGLNKPTSIAQKEEYEKELKKRKDAGYNKMDFENFKLQFPVKNLDITGSEKVSGNTIKNSSNIKLSYEIYDAENVSYSTNIYR